MDYTELIQLIAQAVTSIGMVAVWIIKHRESKNK